MFTKIFNMFRKTTVAITKDKTLGSSEPRVYELWIKTIVKGSFIVQENATPIMTFSALSEDAANCFARNNGGYAIPFVGK